MLQESSSLEVLTVAPRVILLKLPSCCVSPDKTIGEHVRARKKTALGSFLEEGDMQKIQITGKNLSSYIDENEGVW